MIVKWVDLENYRNYRHVFFELSPTLNVFVGENGQGKTNALESIFYLGIGKSHRTVRDYELIQFGETRSTLKTLVEHEIRNYQLEIQIEENVGKKAWINHAPYKKMSDYIGHLQVVLFSPEDLQLLKGSPALRRRFLDIEIGQSQPTYLYHLALYNKTLQQRNRFLKSHNIDESLLDILDEQLSIHGSYILLKRIDFFKDLNHIASSLYEKIAYQKEKLNIKYDSSLRIDDAYLYSFTIHEFQEALYTGLQKQRKQDIHQCITTIGPHRDDLLFYLNEKDAKKYGSQGQQRTIALSLRLAEIELLYKLSREYPVLLLDDVLSELDDDRQKNLLLSMTEKVQTILTTTSWSSLADYFRMAPKLYKVDSGILTSEG